MVDIKKKSLKKGYDKLNNPPLLHTHANMLTSPCLEPVNMSLTRWQKELRRCDSGKDPLMGDYPGGFLIITKVLNNREAKEAEREVRRTGEKK